MTSDDAVYSKFDVSTDGVVLFKKVTTFLKNSLACPVIMSVKAFRCFFIVMLYLLVMSL